ncbi:MAG: M18 family aminopeptidase [Candidatus Marinimicrobia bacterium]|nr:M18 family aminopeptidase [Candidatus Neomarinimicrobiota bacterium]MCF7850982.1 M18 family aminopeptidase [Candidatus Neomarinimicrobiota bacterium]MCF7905135.1 M18 family aminopeptidase [Candidatus Neomarinimicrobiota bacterium]
MPSPMIKDMLTFLDKSVTAFHAVLSSESELQQQGFVRLNENEAWELKPSGKYYVIRDESALAAWQMGTGERSGIKLVGAHTDSPGLHVKPNAVVNKSGYVQLGVEVYGGPLLASWTDRDLSLAGRVIIKEDNKLVIKAYRSDQVLLRVPQLAIHLNREVNDKGLLLNKQTHLPPILTLETTEENPFDIDSFKSMLASDLGVEQSQIMNWQLECYDTQAARLSGLNQEFIVSGRIDNLTMCHAALKALTGDASARAQTSLIALFDNEEIGSGTSNGAASSFVRDIIHRILDKDGGKHELQKGLADSFCISADGAHAVHPNYSEFHDPEHAVEMNKGPVIKVNANHRYATSAMSASIFEQLCQDVDVPVQRYVHKTDLPCGSTIGPITATGLGIPVVDVGNAMLSMHSIRETAGTSDHEMMIKVLSHFFRKDDVLAV